MKKIIAIAAIIASAQASAFFGDDGNTNHVGNGAFDTAGNGEAEATFSMNFTGKGKSDMKAAGTADSNTAAQNSSYPYYAAPVAPAAQ